MCVYTVSLAFKKLDFRKFRSDFLKKYALLLETQQAVSTSSCCSVEDRKLQFHCSFLLYLSVSYMLIHKSLIL